MLYMSMSPPRRAVCNRSSCVWPRPHAHHHFTDNQHCVLNIPLGKAEAFLKTFNMLAHSPFFFHDCKKDAPGGRLLALSFHPFGKTSLHCCFLTPRIVNETCIDGVCTKTQCIKNCFALACSSAHMFSQEHAMFRLFCRERQLFTHKFLSNEITKLTICLL